MRRMYATYLHSADSMFAPIQWETLLQSNAVSHWLSAKPRSSSYRCRISRKTQAISRHDANFNLFWLIKMSMIFSLTRQHCPKWMTRTLVLAVPRVPIYSGPWSTIIVCTKTHIEPHSFLPWVIRIRPLGGNLSGSCLILLLVYRHVGFLYGRSKWLYRQGIFVCSQYKHKRLEYAINVLAVSWWRHAMETLSLEEAICDGNPPADSHHKWPLLRTGWIPLARSQWWGTLGVFWPGQTAKQTIKLTVI